MVKMSFWFRVAAIFRVFCFLSKFSKLFSKRLNQKVAFMPGVGECRTDGDPESYVFEKKYGSNPKRDSITRDGRYVIKEYKGKVCGMPVPVTHIESSSTEQGRATPSETFSEVNDRSRDRTVHEVIELFDKPNDIETSLPRYQNKTPQIINKRNLIDERPKVLPEKIEKLKEQLQQKLFAGLEKCKSERNFRVPLIEDSNHNNKKTILAEEYKTMSELKKIWKVECKGVENFDVLESLDQKSEKEKQNCLLKVNQSQLNKNNTLNGSGESVKSNIKNSFELSERKCYKPFVEMNYLNKLARKDEKPSVEYGGGWDCHRCGERVYHAERMLACGNAYHKTCFSCINCKKLLGPRTYLEAEMEIHCSQCHAKKFGPTGYGYGLGPGVLQTSP